MDARAVLVAVALACGGCTVRVTERMLLARRPSALPEMPDDVARENVTVLAGDGVALRGWHLRPTESARTVVFFYGNAGSVLGAAWALHWLAHALRAEVYAVDYRGYGFSAGEPAVDRFADDALRVYDFAAAQSPGRPVVVVGQSMGGASALHVAARREVAGVVLLAPVSSVDDVVAALDRRASAFVRVEADASLRAVRTSPLADLARTRAPTLIVHGLADEVATPAVIRRFREAPGPPRRELCAVPGGHGDVGPVTPEVRACVERFVGGP